MRLYKLCLDFIERQRCGVDNAGIARTLRKQFAWHDRAGIEADRTARDQVPPAHRDEVRRTRPRSDEMHRHGGGASVSASAQVTGPTAMRAAMRRAVGPAAARAAASATDGTPASAITRSDLVIAPALAAARWPCDIRTRGAPIADAAAAIPGSSRLASDVAIRRSSDIVWPTRANAVLIAASISTALVPLRHPTPATIMI